MAARTLLEPIPCHKGIGEGEAPGGGHVLVGSRAEVAHYPSEPQHTAVHHLGRGGGEGGITDREVLLQDLGRFSGV